MSDWRECRLGELAEVLDSRRVPVRAEDRPRGSVPYYGANGQQGWIDRSLFDEPLVLLAEDGGHFEEFVDRPIAYRIDGPSWVNNHAHVLRAAAGVDQGYLFWSLRNRDIRHWTAGGTRSKLTRGQMEQIVMTLPPSEEQRRIAEILDTIDDAIQAIQRAVLKYKRIRAGLATGLLSEGSESEAPKNWKSGLSRIDGPHRLQQQVGKSNWVAARLRDLAESIVDGPFGSDLKTEHYVQDAGVRVVRLANLSEGRYLNEDEAFIDRDHARLLSRHDVRSGDILVASLGDDNHRPGRACLYPAGFAPGIVKADCFRIRPLSSVDPLFLMEILNSRRVTSQIRRLAQGVTRDRINLGQLGWVVLHVPPLEEQRRIAEIIDTVDQTVHS